MNLIRQVHQGLQIELRSVMLKAISKNERVTGTVRKLQTRSGNKLVRLQARPLLHAQPKQPLFLIIFEELDIDPAIIPGEVTEGQQTRITELEHDLQASTEHVNTLIEELETSNEELQALNEELQSSNEELQASNEELETSNEELEASNEELETAYTELNMALEEIERQNTAIKDSEHKLKALLNNTLQGFVMLDRDYKVVVCNQTATEIYSKLFKVKLQEGASYVDVLRPESFADFKSDF